MKTKATTTASEKKHTLDYSKESMDFAISSLACSDIRFKDQLIAAYFFHKWKYKEEGKIFKPTFREEETWQNVLFIMTEDERLFFNTKDSTRVICSVEKTTEATKIQLA
jgi:hypothetical protein